MDWDHNHLRLNTERHIDHFGNKTYVRTKYFFLVLNKYSSSNMKRFIKVLQIYVSNNQTKILVTYINFKLESFVSVMSKSFDFVQTLIGYVSLQMVCKTFLQRYDKSIEYTTTIIY